MAQPPSASEFAIESVRRQMEELRSADAAIAAGLARRTRRDTRRASVVFSLRLDPVELRAIETRAAAVDIKPSVLARNLIRAGLLASAPDLRATKALARVSAAIADLRELLT